MYNIHIILSSTYTDTSDNSGSSSIRSSSCYTSSSSNSNTSSSSSSGTKSRIGKSSLFCKHNSLTLVSNNGKRLVVTVQFLLNRTSFCLKKLLQLKQYDSMMSCTMSPLGMNPPPQI